MRVDFTKMHGLGNDFIVLDAPAGTVSRRRANSGSAWRRATRALASIRRWCWRSRGAPDTAAYYRVFNADGGEVEQCGNGARCIAALLRQRGAAPGRS